MSELNLLTQRLLDEGYTKEAPPDFVKPWNDFYGGFEYRIDYQNKMVFKTSCGLLVKGSHWNSGTTYFMGVTWSLENNNPLISCPFNKNGCELNHPFLRDRKAFGYIVSCMCSETSEEFDYEKSIDKVFDDKAKHEQILFETFKAKKKGRVCSDMCRFDERENQWVQQYNPIEICSKSGCTYCTILQRELSSKKGNVFYDVKEIRDDTTEGLLNIGDIVTIRKGIRFLEKNCSIDICEIIVKKFKSEIKRKFEMKHHTELYFSKYHGIKYEFEILNVRAEKRVSRDLEQDLADISEGIEVIHDSDSQEAAKQAKRERTQKNTEARIRKYKRMMKEQGFYNLDTYDKRKIEKMIQKGLIDENEIIYEPEKKPEQLSFF